MPEHQTVMQITIYEKRCAPFEATWLKLYNEILLNGIIKETRNAKTQSINDVVLKMDLAEGFPILTIKYTFFKGIVEELLWMLRGETNAKLLAEKKIHVWDANSSRVFLDARGLTNYEEGDIGPGYGFQMRYYGCEYNGCDPVANKLRYPAKLKNVKSNEESNEELMIESSVESNEENTQFEPFVDQLMECIRLIKYDPNSRRIIINLWNVSDINKMALPPCHLLYQFTVSDGKLNCHLYQRSWDMLLGWNASTAALLTHIMAHHTGLKVGTLTHTICDLHLYLSHSNVFSTLNNFCPHQLPKLKIKTSVKNIEDYAFEDFELIDYNHHGTQKLNMKA
jgi:dihydrofolate reductase/thymidylate synthase